MSEKDDKGQGPIKQRQDYFAKIFEETKHFTESLIKENERLRSVLVKIKAESEHTPALQEVTKKLTVLEQENTNLKKQLSSIRHDLASVEDENREFAERYISIERQNNDLASLYVASYRLHATLMFDQVLEIIKEIVINLIGSEVFGIYLVFEEGQLKLSAQEGLDQREGQVIAFGEGIEGMVAQKVEDFFMADVSQTDSDDPIACVALKVHGECVGVIAIYELLGHKEKLDTLDFELCSLLASHAATAIYSAQLFGKVERKLDTYKNLVDLIKES